MGRGFHSLFPDWNGRLLPPALLAALAPAAVSCGGAPVEPWASQRAAIIDGTEDAEDPAVVYIIIDSGAGQFAAATGTVVSPHVILTAAHVLSVFDTPTFRLFTGLNHMETANDVNEWLTVVGAHADPGFNARVMTSGHDVAVLILGSPTAIPPLRFNRTPATLAWIGTTVRTVGYGITSSTDSVGATAGVRRQAITAITGVNSYTFSSATGGEQPCGGDSGGPAFMNVDGVEVIAGVVSNGDVMCTGVSFARVDTSAAFVDQWIAKLDPQVSVDGGSDLDASEISGDEGAARAEEDAAADAGAPIDPVVLDPPSADACAMRRRRGAPWVWSAMAMALALAHTTRRRPRSSRSR